MGSHPNAVLPMNVLYWQEWNQYLRLSLTIFSSQQTMRWEGKKDLTAPINLVLRGLTDGACVTPHHLTAMLRLHVAE